MSRPGDVARTVPGVAGRVETKPPAAATTAAVWRSGDRASAVRRAGLAVVTATTVAALAAADGGYGAVTWGWTTLWLLWLTSMALIFRGTIRVGPLERTYALGLAGLAVWFALSSAWSDDVGRSLLEVQRVLVYLAAAGALLLVRRNSVTYLLAGVLAGVVSIATYALATRLLPDRLGYGGFAQFAAYRLQEPIGYWNALGVFCVIGAILAVAFAGEARPVVARVLAGCAFPLLLCTLYFTFSRGSWVALAVGVVAMLAVGRRRLQLVTTLVVLAPTTAVAVWAASRADGLTRQVATAQQAVDDGHGFGLVLLALLAVTALAVTGWALAERRFRPSRAVRRAYGGALIAVAVVGAIGVLAVQGGPVRIVERVHDGFVASAPTVDDDLNDRLFNLSSNGRVDLWALAADRAGDDLLAGTGGGTYEREWLRGRSIDLKVRDAHNLYLEVLAELGVIGLGLLVVALLPPLLAVRRARGRPVAVGAFGAYVAFLVHAAVDWDWEVTAVTLAALLCALGVLVAGRPDSARALPGLLRAALLALVVVLGALSLVGVVGSSALSASHEAYDTRDLARAEREARTAVRWTPWSAAPLQQLAQVQLAAGRPDEAREQLRRAAVKAPDDWSIQLNLAEATQDTAGRRAALARVRSLNPRSRELRLFEETLERRDAAATAAGDPPP